MFCLLIVDDNQNRSLEFDEILSNGKRVIIKSGLLGMMWHLLENAKTEEELGMDFLITEYKNFTPAAKNIHPFASV